jgi:hypothetical protein
MPKSTRPFSRFRVTIGSERDWSAGELENLIETIRLFARILGGEREFRRRIGELVIERVDTGAHLALAYRDRIELSARSSPSPWSVVHELAHVWDAKNDWGLSRTLQRFSGGFTSRPLSRIWRIMPGAWDAGPRGMVKKPGRYGRKPGCNAAGYFFGDKPSGSNWNFDRREDFAESVVMYCGWGRKNPLSKTAHARIDRYLLPNGRKDPIYRIADNWRDYARYFYPPGGDYTGTKRWQFVHDLIHDRSA